MADLDMLKPTEAAVVAAVGVKDIHRVIDERLLPEVFFSLEGGRSVSVSACTLISFYFDSAKRLTSEERLCTIRTFVARIDGSRAHPVSLSKEEWTVKEGFLTIDLFPFAKRTKKRMADLVAARDMVVSDPEILGGTPVIRGTRIPVYDVAASVSAGLPAERILSAYPSITEEMVKLAVTYATANPARGRPRSERWNPEEMRLVTHHRRARLESSHLAVRLAGHGMTETKASIASKLARGPLR